MKTLAKERRHRLDSDHTARVLDHSHRSRLARAAQRDLGLSIEQVAEKAGVCTATAGKFLGLWAPHTQDPRSSTTFRILHALEFKITISR